MKTEKEIQKQIEELERDIYENGTRNGMNVDIIETINKSYSEDIRIDNCIRVRNVLKWVLK